MLTRECNSVKEYLESEGGIITSIGDPKTFFDVAIFTPGVSPSPFFYGEPKLKDVHTDVKSDMIEASLFRAIPATTPKIGFGRGAQFLNIMNGGGSFQKITGHMGDPHAIMDFMTWDEYLGTSLHSEEMIPAPNSVVLAGAQKADRKESFGSTYIIEPGSKNHQWSDIEATWIEHTNCLCFQPRPDFNYNGMPKDGSYRKAVDSTRELFDTYFEDWVKPKIKSLNV